MNNKVEGKKAYTKCHEDWGRMWVRDRGGNAGGKKRLHNRRKEGFGGVERVVKITQRRAKFKSPKREAVIQNIV